MSPTPEDRAFAKHLVGLAECGEPLDPRELFALIDFHDRLAVARCKRCREREQSKEQDQGRRG